PQLFTSSCFCPHPSTTEIYTLSLHDALPISSDKNILLSIGVHTRCVWTKRIVDGHQRRQFFPENWEVTEIESLNHVSVAYDGSYRLPSKTGLRFGEYRLIREFRNHAIAILPGNIFGG